MVTTKDLKRLMSEFMEVLGGEVTLDFDDLEMSAEPVVRWLQGQDIHPDAIHDIADMSFETIYPMVERVIAQTSIDPGKATKVVILATLSTMFAIGWEAQREYGVKK